MSSRWLRAGLLTALLALSAAGVASAHAILLRAEPADGAVLAEPPRQARLWFSEAVLPAFTTVQLASGDGQEIPLPPPRADPADPTIIAVDLPTLAPDAYRLTWSTASDDDFHSTTGSIVFGVQQAADLASAPADAAPPQAAEVALRWLNFIALAGLTGSLALALVAVPAPIAGGVAQDSSLPISRIESLRRSALNIGLWSAGFAVVAGVGLVLVQTGADGEALTRVLTQTGYGAHWLMRQAWLIVVASILGLHLRGRLLPEASPRTLSAVLAPLVAAVVVSQAMSSHAAAGGDASFAPVAVDALHLLAAGVWVGGLLSLAITIVPLLRRGPPEKALARSILRRFSVLAAGSVALLAVTGLISSGQQVASLDALLFTFYGRSLLLKTGLVAGVALIGLINSALVHPRVADAIRRLLRRPVGWTPLPARFLWRTLALEALGATTVLLLAAVLSAAQPALGPEFGPPGQEASAISSVSTNAADLLITLSIKPNRPGRNFIDVGVFNTRRPPPAPVERVTLKLASSSAPDAAVTLAADADEAGRYEFPSDALTSAGSWQISVSVARPGQPDVVLDIPWQVAPPASAARARPVVVSNQPLAPWTNLLAGLMTAGLGAGLAAWGWRRASRSHALRRVRAPALVQPATEE